MNLEYLVRMKCGTSPDEPTREQIIEIVIEIRELYNRCGVVTHDDLKTIVANKCPTAGSWFYKGIDTVDILTLLELMLAQSGDEDE